MISAKFLGEGHVLALVTRTGDIGTVAVEGEDQGRKTPFLRPDVANLLTECDQTFIGIQR